MEAFIKRYGGWLRLAVTALALALTLSGVTGRFWNWAVRPVMARNDAFLERAIGDTMHLMIPVGVAKAAADVIEGSRIEADAGVVVASAGVSIEVGDTVQPVLEYINLAWNILMASLVSELALRYALRGTMIVGMEVLGVALAALLALQLWRLVTRGHPDSCETLLRRVSAIGLTLSAVLLLLLPLTVRFTAHLSSVTTEPLRREVRQSFEAIGEAFSLQELNRQPTFKARADYLVERVRQMADYAAGAVATLAGAIAKLAVIKLLNGIVFPLLSVALLVWLVRAVLYPLLRDA